MTTHTDAAADTTIPAATPEHAGAIKGHRLSCNGAPFSEKGRRVGPRGSLGGTGWGKCDCGAFSETALPSAAARRRWHRQHKAAILAATDAAQAAGDAAYTAAGGSTDGQPVPDGQTRQPPTSTWDGAVPAADALEALPASLTEGLTIWGGYGGAQIRLETPLAVDEAGDLLIVDGAPVIAGPPIGCIYLAFRDDAPRSAGEDLAPYRLDLTEARALRDLLNMATARGAL